MPKPITQDHPSSTESQIIDDLTTLICVCFPDMPQASANALAASEAMIDLRAISSAYHQALASPHFNTDFVLVVFYHLVQRALAQLNDRIAGNPAYQQALSASGLDWRDAE